MDLILPQAEHRKTDGLSVVDETPRKLIVLDSSLRTMVGHNFHYQQALKGACTRRGWGWGLYAHDHCTAEIRESLDAIPAFSLDPYATPVRLPRVRAAANFLIGNWSFWRGLRHLRDETLSTTDILFLHLVNENQLFAAGRWWRSLEAAVRPHMVVQLPFETGARIGRDGKLAWPAQRRYLYALALRSLRPWLGRSVWLAADNRPLAEEYSEVFSAPVGVLPHAYLPNPGPPRGSDEKGPEPVLVSLGDARLQKGFAQLAQAVKLLQERQVGVRLVIQTARFRAEPSELLDAVASLQSAANGRVELLPDPLSPEEYETLLHRADAVMLPYDPITYATRTSGVFAEAMALGKPIITTAGSWMARELSELGNPGLIMSSWDGESLAAAVETFVDDPGAWRDRAVEAASRWTASHGADKYLDVIEQWVEAAEA